MIPRQRISYFAERGQGPADPFATSEIVVEVDGRARLDEENVQGRTAWRGSVPANVLDALWAALEESRFPDRPELPFPVGSAGRYLTIGDGFVCMTYDVRLPGYDTAFSILDGLVRQLREGGSSVPPKNRLTPGAVWYLAWLPAHRIAIDARLALLDRLEADPTLAHAIDFSRRATTIEESTLEPLAGRIAFFGSRGEVNAPSMPQAKIGAWIEQLALAVRPHLDSRTHERAWSAGEIARRLTVSVALAAHVAHLRCSAPDHPELSAQAELHARHVRESTATLNESLAGLALAERATLPDDPAPTTSEGYAALNEHARVLDAVCEKIGRMLLTVICD